MVCISRYPRLQREPGHGVLLLDHHDPWTLPDPFAVFLWIGLDVFLKLSIKCLSGLTGFSLERAVIFTNLHSRLRFLPLKHRKDLDVLGDIGESETQILQRWRSGFQVFNQWFAGFSFHQRHQSIRSQSIVWRAQENQEWHEAFESFWSTFPAFAENESLEHCQPWSPISGC